VLIEKYMVSAENQFVILAALRSDFCRVVTTTTWGNWRHEIIVCLKILIVCCTIV